MGVVEAEVITIPAVVEDVVFIPENLVEEAVEVAEDSDHLM